MILITTPGKVGSEAARLLAAAGSPVRVLARHPEKATALAAAGAEVLTGDLGVTASIDAAMDGVDAVVLVSPAVPEQERNVIDSAFRAGVGHVVKITSPASADSPIARQRGQVEIEEALIASGLPYTLLRNNFYMQNFLMLARGIAATGGFGASAGSGQVGVIDSRDVGAVAARVAAAPAGHAGRTYALTGPELLSYADIAATLSRVLSTTVTFTARTREQDTAEMVAAGLPEPVAAMNALAVSQIDEGAGAWLSDDVELILRRPARSFEEFATDYAPAFASS